MPTSLENLREVQRHDPGRPRSEEVEDAWQRYTRAFTEWARIADSRVLCDHETYEEAERQKEKALIHHRGLRDLRLFEYYEVYDRDQRRAFSGENSTG